jgi:UDP-N-acetyl-D-galactosamine dehydrogenase
MAQKKENERKVALVGLGYVGLPIAVAFGRRGKVIGFDINKAKIEELQRGFDRMGEMSAADLQDSDVQYTSDPTDLKAADFIIVAVPTPINAALRPDLKPLRMVSELIGKNISPGTIVVFESTVYPGVTEDICLPILEDFRPQMSIDFKVGYSQSASIQGTRSILSRRSSKSLRLRMRNRLRSLRIPTRSS